MNTWNLDINFYDNHHTVKIPMVLRDDDGRTIGSVLLSTTLADIIHEKVEELMEKKISSQIYMGTSGDIIICPPRMLYPFFSRGDRINGIIR